VGQITLVSGPISSLCGGVVAPCPEAGAWGSGLRRSGGVAGSEHRISSRLANYHVLLFFPDSSISDKNSIKIPHNITAELGDGTLKFHVVTSMKFSSKAVGVRGLRVSEFRNQNHLLLPGPILQGLKTSTASLPTGI